MASGLSEKAAHIIKGVTLASLYIFSYILLQALFGAVLGACGADVINDTGVAALMAAVTAYLIFGITLWLRGIKRVEEYRVSRPVFFDILFAAALAVGFRLMTIAYMEWLENIEPLAKSIEEAQLDYDIDSMTYVAMAALSLSMFVIAPIFEEILFRGIAMTELKRVMPAPCAIVIQGILFGVSHMVLAQSIFACVFGVILGFIYHKTEKLSVTMTAHFVFNLSAVLELREGFSIAVTAAAGAVITAAAVAMFAAVYGKSLRRNYGG